MILYGEEMSSNDMILKGMSKSLKYKWGSLIYQFQIGLQ